MEKKRLIKFKGYRIWKGKKLMVKFEIAEMPAGIKKKVIKEIRKCKGIFWPPTEGWYVPAEKYSKLKGRIKRQNFSEAEARAFSKEKRNRGSAELKFCRGK